MCANRAMHQSSIDDTLSGTTSITVILRGNTLLVANVGDSRAIIASEMEEGLVYSPLSDDQTPFRRDERERVKLKGARVLTLEQIEGNEPIHENWGTDTGDIIDEVCSHQVLRVLVSDIYCMCTLCPCAVRCVILYILLYDVTPTSMSAFVLILVTISHNYIDYFYKPHHNGMTWHEMTVILILLTSIIIGLLHHDS